ncbi:nitric oxide reductase activation protein NorD [Noviherbaspirillum sp. Root189]|uniref:nitric oxide reductase activation protein NorD n=1 Tax=Noviherbaspirillum sp. Root189 TaxID=1736487 RepID=UPI00070B2548|nr:hypothetical protein [Noviherbaspirillum sp. Root189]KRB67972.1 hypothetical protein ASE07_09985 [Noviherbaspirillum sp. Root189]
MQESMQSARLMAYALWSTELQLVAMKAFDKSAIPARPVLERQVNSASTLHMPASAGFLEGVSCGAIHAAAAHAAAHMRFGSGHADDTAIKPLHQAVLGVLEDARVESLAMEELPGLRRLWQVFHEELATDDATLEALLRRLTRALFAPEWKDTHPWIEKGRRLYLGARSLGWAELRQAASILANDIGQMRVGFDAVNYLVQPAYRDDNTHLWRMPEGRAIESPQPLDQPDPSEETFGSRGAGCRAEDDATDLRLLGVVPEWDRLISRYRADWCSLLEVQPSEGNPATLFAQMQAQTAWINGLARRIRKATSMQPQLVRANAGGDFHETALIDAGIALRAGSMPDAGIYLRTAATHEPRRIVFIVDASVSTVGPCPPWLAPSRRRLLYGMALLTALACAAFEQAGHDCTILGFNSNTRHCVRIQPIKNEEEPVSSSSVLARLVGLTPEWSTRSGAAVRYAMQLLHDTSGSMIVLVSDGQPHDVDIHDPRYLPEDLQRAAQEARRRGVTVLGLEIGPESGMAPGVNKAPGWLCTCASSLSMTADAIVHAIRQGTY